MKKTISKLWNNDFLKGSAVFTLTSFATNVINYFFNIITARALGPAGYGEITALFSYTVIFSVPTLVMSLVIIQKIGSKGEIAPVFALSLKNWFFFKLGKWWPLIIPALLISPFIPWFTNLSPASGYILIPFILLSFIAAFYGAILHGLALLLWVSVIGIATSLLKLAGAVFVMFGVDGIHTVLAFLLLATAAQLYLSHTAIKTTIARKGGSGEHIDKRIVHAIFNRQVVITFLSVLAITIFNNIDIILVKKVFSANDTGIYSSWSLLAKIILYVTGPFSMVSYIFFSSKSRRKNHENLLLLSLGMLTIIAASSYVVYRYFSTFVIGLFFGSKYQSVAPYLAGASLFGSFYTIITFINNYFLALKSRFSLTLILFIPVYFLLFFIIPRTLGSIMLLNIYFSAAVTMVYLVAYAWVFFHNRLNKLETVKA